MDTSGIISTFGPVGIPGTDYYNSVVTTPDGNLYLGWTHFEPGRGTKAYLVRVGADASFTTVAGNGELCGSQTRMEYPNGPALNAPLCSIFGLRSDAAGNIYATDGYYGVVLKFAGGNLTRVVGSAVAEDSRDGDPALSTKLFASAAVDFHAAGNLVSPQGSPFFFSNRIRAVPCTCCS